MTSPSRNTRSSFVFAVFAVFALATALVAAGCDDSSGANGDDDNGNGDGGDGFADAGDGGLGENGDSGVLCGQLPATIRDFKIEHPDFETPDSHSDVSLPGIVQSQLGVDKKPVYALPGPSGTQVSGADNFNQWYRDVPGVNLKLPYTIHLTDQGGGIYGFASNAFFPIDNLGWGNEALAHNYHFTTEVHTSFKYKGGETFSFTGDDDLWLFINGKLAIDLGGMHPSLSAVVNLDQKAAELGIVAGGTYDMDIFHAERHTVASNFKVETTIDCFIVQ